MGHKFLMGWAIAASAIALLLLGILIGRSSGESEPMRVVSGYDTAGIDTSRPDAAEIEAVPTFIVPEIFEGVPTEWRTATDDDAFDGYAILFEPARREVIVEQCLHRGYVTDDGSPLDTNYEFCVGVLWANVLVMSDTDATVRTRTGEVVELEFALSEDDEQLTLTLSFPGHEMALIPGSKNDLLQAIDTSPRMTEEKRKQFEALQALYEQQLRAQQAATEANEREIPRYTLPAGAEEDERD